MASKILESSLLLENLSPSSTSSLRKEQLKVELSVDFTFNLHFTRNVFDPANRTLMNTVRQVHEEKNTKMMFVVDLGVMDSYSDLQEQILGYCRIHHLPLPGKIITIPGGEEAKTERRVAQLHDKMLDLKLDRHSFIVAIGGGAVLDSVGYAATTFHRGVRLIRMPTTVLSQNDAGIGVKNGINVSNTKNLLGCFAPPFAVINDSAWLTSLSDRDYRSGFAEAVKVGLIRDGEYYQWLCSNTDKLIARDHDACHYLIKRCAELHLNQISCGGDPFERGNARPLDYGHWSAHKLESLSNYDLSHGESVAIGIALDGVYAFEAGLFSSADITSIIRLLKALGFILWHPALTAVSAQGKNLLLKGLEEFRQHLGGRLCITLLTGLGTAIEVDVIDADIMLKAIGKLQHLSNSP